MRQIVQDQGQGKVNLVDVPPPVSVPSGVLVAVKASVISSGTERSKIEMGEKSLVGKARARPDLAKKVLDQVRRDGLRQTAALVRDRLGTPQPLGYSAAGVVLAVGEYVEGVRAGMLVSCGGAGYANHAEVVQVPGHLCVPVPDGVQAASAAFATIGSIGLHGIRQAGLTAGETVAVSGLGLVGQLCVRLLRAYGHPVIGIDPSAAARGEVADLGVATYAPDDDRLTRLGADAVLLCASTSSNEPIATAPTWCRDRGRVVVVGDVGLGLPRSPYYDGEVEVRFSRSYGPGRYDPTYEERGVDYPIGYVRWTEQRNMGEVLRLIAAGALRVDDLVTESFLLDRATEAYDRLAHGLRVRALLIEYDYPAQPGAAVPEPAPIELGVQPRRAGAGKLGVGLCGAGNFTRKVLIPGLAGGGDVRWVSIASATGVTARHVGEKHGFRRVAPTAEAVIRDGEVDAVVIATRHDTHARLAAMAAESERFAYVEKPLAITHPELDELEKVPGAPGRLVVGFNRRHAPAVEELRRRSAQRDGGLNLDIRVNAGRLRGHWSDDLEQGGRLAGELCHFVDLALFLVGSPAAHLTVAAPPDRAARQTDTVQVLLTMADSSSATISYLANGGSGLAKERVEAHWDGRSFVIDDFRHWYAYDRTGVTRGGKRRQDKGHRTLMTAFVEFALGRRESPVPFHQAVHSTRVTLAVLDAICSGNTVTLGPAAW